MLTRRHLLSAAPMAALAAPAAAQEAGLPPRYGTITLSPGFMPDPHVRRVQAGGGISLAERFRSCPGHVDNRPDVNLVWTGGSRLFISVRAPVDTTLLVNGADGRWYCDDDTEGHNPRVVFNPGQRGQYNIWVGCFDKQLAWVELRISEMPA
jgi:hypothetical protein